MEIQAKTPSIKGPADWFSGDVWIDLVSQQGDVEWGAHITDTEYAGAQQ